MEKEIKISCPCCRSMLVIDRISGHILETREPLVENSTGDRLEDAFLKAEQDKKKRASALDNLHEQQERKKRLAEDFFNASLEDARKEEDVKPHSIFDAD